MRKLLLTGACALIISATPAAAAQGGGGGGGHGGGPGGGMGAGPPISPPGLSGMGPGTADLAHGIASQQGQFGRDFAAQRHLTPQEYQALAQQHRMDALALAQAARGGAHIPASAGPRIRQALSQDIDAWRAQFQVDRKNWQAMRDLWLSTRGTMSPQEWAIRRADWFAARDAWIANQKAWASARRH